MDRRPVEKWRVEDLALRADVSVDTIRFYQKRRLLSPPEREGRVAWYGPAHLDRLTRIRELAGQGLTLALIGRVLDGNLDATDAPLAAAVAAADAETVEEFFTLPELATRADVPIELLETIAREGLLIPLIHDGVPQYTSADVAIVRQALALLEQGFPMPALIALAQEHNADTRVIAERAVALFDEFVRQPLRNADRPDDEKARELVAAFRVLLPAVSTLVAHHFRRVLLTVAQEHLEQVGEHAELIAASAEAARLVENDWST
ncbi:MAG: MerR family transcriptional regulator [Actinomycetota bacterium]|nr:MerR family transcriptional regulator [Actinomycetota bacterium]